MPNQPKTPGRVIRVPDELWQRVRGRAEKEGTSASAVVRDALDQHVPIEFVEIPSEPGTHMVVATDRPLTEDDKRKTRELMERMLQEMKDGER